MSKRRKQIKAELVPITVEVWQDRPFTAVKVKATYDGGEYTAIGFSKVCWPDWWNKERGEQIASGKALDKIARQIEKIYEAAGWPTPMTSAPLPGGWIGNTRKHEQKTPISI